MKRLVLATIFSIFGGEPPAGVSTRSAFVAVSSTGSESASVSDQLLESSDLRSVSRLNAVAPKTATTTIQANVPRFSGDVVGLQSEFSATTVAGTVPCAAVAGFGASAVCA